MLVNYTIYRHVNVGRSPGVRREWVPRTFAVSRRSPGTGERREYQGNNEKSLEKTALEENQRRGSKKSSKSEQTEILLPRSVLVDKEVITRTSGKRLGYINEMYVDPVRLEVVTLYLRQNISSFGATSVEHVSLSSLRQIGDVVLVHDESSLWDPPGDESMGFVRMIGSEVQTEDGIVLGKVRDFLFNPDNGQIASIRIDALGIPSIPQELLGCSRLDWRDIIAVGPSKTIVRRGAERRAVQESEGWISEYVSTLVNAISGIDVSDDNIMDEKESYRADPAYAAWYAQHAAEYERYYNQTLPKPLTAQAEQTRRARQPEQSGRARQLEQSRRARQPEQTRRARQPDLKKPLALPDPRSVSYDQMIGQERARMPQRRQRVFRPQQQSSADTPPREYTRTSREEFKKDVKPQQRVRRERISDYGAGDEDRPAFILEKQQRQQDNMMS